MKIFLDANILVSVLNKELPVYTHSSRVLSLMGTSKFEIHTSPICLAIAFYFAEKKSGRINAKEKIQLLASKIKIAESDRSTVLRAAADKSIDDFEDGLEYYSALKAGCRCIITQDLDDFYFSKIPVMTAEQFLEEHVL